MCVPARKVRWIRLHTDDTRTAEPMLPAVSLHILGNFELIVGEQHASALEDHPSRLRSLLCYLVLHRDRAVTHDELIENFYSDETQRDPVGALKMQILRLRALLRPLVGEDVSPIRSHRGSYQWDASLPCEVDAEHFEMLCFAAEEPQRSDSERRELYREAMALYRGNVHLEKNEPLWNRTLGTCYFTRYLTAAQKCAALLIDGGEYAEAEALSLRAIAMDPLNESLYAAAIRAMLRQKKYAEARRQYLALADLLHRELGVRPSEELQQLYAQCAKEERSGTQDLGTVMSILGAEEAAQRGAFYWRVLLQLRPVQERLSARAAPDAAQRRVYARADADRFGRGREAAERKDGLHAHADGAAEPARKSPPERCRRAVQREPVHRIAALRQL